ncbi:flavodoxin [Ligaoa zhengdingensis]|nr:flavodoxin [Ligaoa zhengdingensis]
MKRFLPMLLTLSMLFSLTACGGKANNNSTSPVEDGEQQAQGSGADNAAQPSTPSSSSTSESDNSSSEQTQVPDDTATNAIVVYFSCTGNTKAVAEKIAELTGADMYEIVPETPYTDEDLNYRNDDCRANREMNDDSARPAIAGETIDLSGYHTVYLGYPIWWGTMPQIINTFLDTYDLSGKTILPFCTSGGSGISTSVSAIRTQEPDATVTDGLRASGASDEGIGQWLEGNGQ